MSHTDGFLETAGKSASDQADTGRRKLAHRVPTALGGETQTPALREIFSRKTLNRVRQRTRGHTSLWKGPKVGSSEDRARGDTDHSLPAAGRSWGP